MFFSYVYMRTVFHWTQFLVHLPLRFGIRTLTALAGRRDLHDRLRPSRGI
jgi:hypothetical protein